MRSLENDGARGQLRMADGVASLRTRHGRRCRSAIHDSRWRDSVAVLADDGAPDFGALRSRLGRCADRARVAAASKPATFFAFDVLWHNRFDLRDRPLVERLEVLESLDLGGALVAVDSFPGKAAEVLEFVRANELEGIL